MKEKRTQQRNWARALVRATSLENMEHLVSDGNSNGPKVSLQFQFTQGNLNLLPAISVHGKFNLLTAFSVLLTAISITAYGNFNLFTVISILYSRQFQWLSGNSLHDNNNNSEARFKRRATAVPNSIDWIKFDFSTAVARRLKPSRATVV